MSAPLRIGIAGLGTVGGGVLAILQENAALIAARCGRKLEVAAVCARDAAKSRGMDLSQIRWVSDPLALAADPGIDIVVEVMGGSEGAAKSLVEAALKQGKHVVTANKALIAHHGIVLAQLAEKQGRVLAFEAAVAGGIPIIKALRDGLAANRFTRIAGILNGTCNYILTTMREEQRDFPEILKNAMALGYAEADPSFDIDGIDAAHKTAILASLAFGTRVDIDAVHVEGIRRVSLRDMKFAEELGYRIKLLGIAERLEGGGILQRVHPCMVPQGSPMGAVDGVYNAVVAECDAAGRMIFEGRGAGAGPTGSSIVADIMDIARGVAYLPFTLPVAQLNSLPHAAMEELRTSYYLRLTVLDKPGVLADITTLCRDEGISVRSFIQHSHKPGEPVQVVLTTHATGEAHMQAALLKITALSSVTELPHMIRIENL